MVSWFAIKLQQSAVGLSLKYCLLLRNKQHPKPVAYAGFWKGGVQDFQKIWEEQRSESDIVSLKFSSIFRPKYREEQKKKKIFTQISSDFKHKA